MLQGIINPQRGVRTFVFEKEDTQQSVIIDEEISLKEEAVNLNYLFQQYCPLNQNKISVYDPTLGRFSSLAKIGAHNGLLPKYVLEPAVILVRFRKIDEMASESDSVDSSIEDSKGGEKKEGRSKERTIGEVIQVVKKWRELHLHGHKTIRKRLNLQDAARLVGVPKKSLDDYYCQLRLGELYNFDFYSQLEQKMGVLRTYVKNYRPEKEQTIRRQNDKHPKNLRIISEYDLGSHTLKPTLFKEEALGEEELDLPLNVNRIPSERLSDILERKSSYKSEREEEGGEGQSSAIFKELFTLQNQFFKGFQMPMQLQNDPYYDMDRDFRKKDYEFDSNSFMFFQ